MSSYILAFFTPLHQITLTYFPCYVCHQGTERLRVLDGGDGYKMRIVANILSKQSWTAHKGWPLSRDLLRCDSV